MPAFKDITGLKFGRLLVVSFSHMDRHGGSVWNCLCDCGTEKIIRGNPLLMGKVVSCGCFHREEVGNRVRTHGRSKTKLYKIWTSIIQRCTNSNDAGWEDYGARGIYICECLLNDFEVFAEYVGEKPPGKMLDRIDNNGPYSKGNLRWATPLESEHNKRRTGRLPIDLSGQRFGRLTVLRFLDVKNTHSRFACLCDCGTEIIASGHNLKQGSVASCGCLRRSP